MVQVSFEIGGKPIGSLVAAHAVLLQAFHHDPIKIAPQQRDGFPDS